MFASCKQDIVRQHKLNCIMHQYLKVKWAHFMIRSFFVPYFLLAFPIAECSVYFTVHFPYTCPANAHCPKHSPLFSFLYLGCIHSTNLGSNSPKSYKEASVTFL